uniref:Uncharacterized protein n=1 Tax=Varanus komodoensis TaxID=61221 RepID=A0A8D2Q606_VARKO
GRWFNWELSQLLLIAWHNFFGCFAGRVRIEGKGSSKVVIRLQNTHNATTAFPSLSYPFTEKKDFPSPPDTVPGGEGKPWDALEDWNAIAISEEVAKRAFEKYVATKCCYSEVPAREMEIREAQSFNTYRYCLETFVESRSSKWKTEPYRGDPVDSSPDGMAPYPWAVRVDASAMFKNETRKVIVPHTSSVMVD